MQYKGNDIDVQSGDIILFRNEFIWYEPLTWLSFLVRYFTGCYYNHCGLVVKNWGIPFLSESNAKGIITRPLQKYIERSKTKIIVLRPKKPELSEANFCLIANSMIGLKYDFKSLLFYQLIYRITGKWYGATYRAAIADGMVCSEYVAWCYALPEWWLYSSQELYNCDLFYVVYRESFT